MTAYSPGGATYYKSERVYVQIPQNDTSLQKFIVGRVAENSPVMNLKLPFDDFIPLQKIPLLTESGEKSFKINTFSEGNYPLLYSWESPSGMIGQTKLGITMDVTSLLYNYNVERIKKNNGKLVPSAQYGLLVYLSGKTKTTAEAPSEDRTISFFFTCNDMYGNPYAFTVPFTQQKLIDISDFLEINSIKIYYYEDNNFVNSLTGELIEPDLLTLGVVEDEDGNIIRDESMIDESAIYPITLDNIEVYLGLTTEELDSDKVFLYTYDNLEYGNNLADLSRGVYDEKELHVAWVHMGEDGQYNVYDTYGEFAEAGAQIFWCHYDYGSNSEDEVQDEEALRYCGYHWKIIDRSGLTSCNIKCDLEKGYEKYKVVIVYDKVYATSDILTFSNTVDQNTLSNSLANNEAIIFKLFREKYDEDSGLWELINLDPQSDFFIYDENNESVFDDNGDRLSSYRYYLRLYIRNFETGEYTPLFVADESSLADIEVEWTLPAKKSMFTYTKAPVHENNWFNVLNSVDFEAIRPGFCEFQVAQTYKTEYKDNVIAAKVRFNGQEYYVQKQFQFGKSGSMGIDYSVRINYLYSNSDYIPANSSFSLQAILYDKNFEIVHGSNYRCEWKFYTNGSLITDITSDSLTTDSFTNNDIFTGILSGVEGFVAEVEITNDDDSEFRVYGRKGIAVSNDAYFMTTREVICADRVEFKSDGQRPIFYTADFVVRRIGIEGEDAYEYPKWEITYNPFETVEQMVLLNEITNEKQNTVHKITYKTYRLGLVAESTDSKIVYPQWNKLLNRSCYCLNLTVDGVLKYSQGLAFDQNLYCSSLVNQWDGTTLTIDEENGAVLATMIAAGTKDNKGSFTGVMMGDWHSKADESMDIPGLYGFQNGAQSFALMTDGRGFIGPAGLGRIEFDGNNAMISNWNKTNYLNLNPTYYDLDFTQLSIDDDGVSLANRGYSPYFLYSEADDLETIEDKLYANLSGPLTLDSYPEESLPWYQTFMESSEKDKKSYFVVHPRKGIFTSGGIVAKYGKLGNWTICNNGLYQAPLTPDDDKSYVLDDYYYRSTDSETRYYRYTFLGNSKRLNDELHGNSNWLDGDSDECDYAFFAGVSPTFMNGLNFLKNVDKKSVPGDGQTLDASMIDRRFSVSWDGSFYAVKGQIANTWVINKQALVYQNMAVEYQTYIGNGLTSQKKSDIIYIGEEKNYSSIPFKEAGSLRETYERLKNDEDYSAELAEYRKAEYYSIAAGTIQGTRTDLVGKQYDVTKNESQFKTAIDLMTVNFGVRQDGFLYAQYGRIGGWSLEEWRLYNESFIVLDAKECEITLADRQIVIDANIQKPVKYSDPVMENGVMIEEGHIISAPYISLGRVKEVESEKRTDDFGLEYDYYIKDSKGDYVFTGRLMPNDRNNHGAIWFGQNEFNSTRWDVEIGAAIGYTGTVKIGQARSLLYLTNFRLFSDAMTVKYQKVGTVASQGIGYSDAFLGENQIIVSYMMSTVSELTLQGQALDIGRTTVRYSEAEDIQGVRYLLTDGQTNMIESRVSCGYLKNWNLEAGWITANAIYMDGMMVATQAWVLNICGQLYEKILEALRKIAALKMLTDAKTEGTKLRFKVKSVALNGSNDAETGNNTLDIELAHVHPNTLQFSAGVLKLTNKCFEGFSSPGATKEDAEIDLKHAHTIKFSEGGSGTVTLTMSNDWQMGETSDSFNMASTKWYKAIVETCRKTPQISVSTSGYGGINGQTSVVTIPLKLPAKDGGNPTDATVTVTASLQGNVRASCSGVHVNGSGPNVTVIDQHYIQITNSTSGFGNS